MGDLYLGGVEPVAIYLGDKAAVAAYLGTEHIWGPAIGDPIAFINGSMGTGRNAGAGSNRTAVGSMLIDEDAFDMMAVAFVAVSHDAWLNGIGDYGTFTMESHLDGPFQRREPVFFGRSDERQVSRQGSLTPFVLPRPSVGLHTITAFVEAPRWATQIEFQVQAYKNVLAVGNQTQNWADRTETKLAVVSETVRENITLCGVAHDRARDHHDRAAADRLQEARGDERAEAGHPCHDENNVGERADRHDLTGVPAGDALTQHEDVLGSDGDDQTGHARHVEAIVVAPCQQGYG